MKFLRTHRVLQVIKAAVTVTIAPIVLVLVVSKSCNDADGDHKFQFDCWRMVVIHNMLYACNALSIYYERNRTGVLTSPGYCRRSHVEILFHPAVLDLFKLLYFKCIT